MRRVGKITICAVLFLMLTNFVNAQDEKSVKGIVGKEHYVSSNGLKVYLWEKYHKDYAKSFKQSKKIVLLVHGGTWTGRPDFDLQIRDYSLMDHLAKKRL